MAFDDASLPAALAALSGLPGVQEVVVVSTCNRTEVYAVTDGDGSGLIDWLATHPQGSADLRAYLYQHHGVQAVQHLFRVAAGLDSMVLGEPQILGQVKQAWMAARAQGTLHGALDRLFQHAFATAKRARTDTRIGAHPVSVASAAVRLAQNVFARLDDSTVLLIGAGETIELAARHLSEGKVRRLLVANRTLVHAQDIATRHGGVALPLSELDRHLAEADVVFSATASRETVVARAQVEAALAVRRHRPMLLVDLAVPRDIDPEIAQLKDAYLYTVDDLQRAVEDNIRSRRESAVEAEAIIELQAARFVEAVDASMHYAPLKRLRAHGDAARNEALEKAKRLLVAGGDPTDALDLLAHTLTNRLLHAPTHALREAALSGDAELARAADKLFPPFAGDDDAAEPAPKA